MMPVIFNPLLETKTYINDPVGFLQAFLPKLVTIALTITAIVFLFMMLIGGISWMTSGGDKTAVEAARSRVTNALVGLFIVFSVFAIAGAIRLLFGVDILNLDIGAILLP